RNLQRQLGLMFIHVTHNQEEALSMAERSVLSNDARFKQVADPLTIARKPATEVVARFMGDNNIIRGRVAESSNGHVIVENDEQVRVRVKLDGATAPAVGEPAQVAIRAAAVQLDDAQAAAGNSIETEIV